MLERGRDFGHNEAPAQTQEPSQQTPQPTPQRALKPAPWLWFFAPLILAAAIALIVGVATSVGKQTPLLTLQARPMTNAEIEHVMATAQGVSPDRDSTTFGVYESSDHALYWVSTAQQQGGRCYFSQVDNVSGSFLTCVTAEKTAFTSDLRQGGDPLWNLPAESTAFLILISDGSATVWDASQ